jgi:arsenite methyltransferase
MSSSPDQVRDTVAKVYGELVAEAEVGPDCGCGASDRKGAVVNFAGYSTEQLADLPSDAVVNSFGCGDPVALAGLREGDTVLDLGSGAGIDLLLAARLVGHSGHVIGVDMTEEMVSRARKNAAEAGLENVEVRKGIIEELPVDDSSVDWVISNCVINLSPEKSRVFAEIARVLRPGGQMLVSDMMARDLPKELLTLPAAYATCIAGAIDEDDYLAGLRAAGLTDVEVRDRLVYDADQLSGAALSQVDCGCGGDQLRELARNYAGRFVGKVWSAKVYARRPA